MNYRQHSINRLTASAACALVAFTLCWLARPVVAQESGPQQQQQSTPALSAAQLETLLNQAYARTVEYTTIFKDLMAEERQSIELYDAGGQLMQRRRIVSDFVVYQSQLDGALMYEYRNVREVDGVAVPDRRERAMNLAERLVKVDSVSKELDRIDREASRYDLNYSVKGSTLNQAMAVQKEVRAAFKFEATGREMIDGHEVIVVSFEQVARHPQLHFNLSLPKVKASAPLYKGRLWLDAHTAQLWREEREIIIRLPKFTDPLPVMRFELHYVPSKFKILVPQRIQFSTVGSVRRVEGRPPILSPGGRVSFEYGPFELFDVVVNPGSFAPQPPR